MRGLASPHPFLGCHLLASCSVSSCCLRRTVGFFCLWICFRTVRFWIDSGYSSCVSLRWLWWLFHTCSCEGVPRILRLILGRSHGFSMRPSYSAVTVPVSTWIFWEMTSGIVRLTGMLRSTVDCSFLRQSPEPSLMAATCPVPYVADDCAKMRNFWVMTSRVISAFSAYWLDSGTCMASSTGAEQGDVPVVE